MKLKEIPLCGYLSYDEALDLVSFLKENKIHARKHGMTSGDGNDQDIYQVFINESDLNFAIIIAKKIQRRFMQNS